MQTKDSVNLQLAKLGFGGSWFGRGEVLALPRYLRSKEKILAVLFGLHKGGTVLLVATDKRLLYVDKRFYHCKCDDIPYHMIGGVEEYAGLLGSKIKISYRGGEIILSKIPKQRASHFVQTVERKVD